MSQISEIYCDHCQNVFSAKEQYIKISLSNFIGKEKNAVFSGISIDQSSILYHMECYEEIAGKEYVEKLYNAKRKAAREISGKAESMYNSIMQEDLTWSEKYKREMQELQLEKLRQQQKDMMPYLNDYGPSKINDLYQKYIESYAPKTDKIKK
jgi:hypothetical protein